MKKFKIGLAGFGVVGVGVFEILRQKHQYFLDRYGVDFEINAILVKNISLNRNVSCPKHLLSTDRTVLNDSDIVVELIGGLGIAQDIIIDALDRGQHVVTANKALLADQWKQIHAKLQKSKSLFYFEAAVAGAVPVIKTIEDSLSGNAIESIKGIINGTSNYILSTMETTHQEFTLVLKEAQRLGFAEADPSFDIDGVDVAHKLSILIALSYEVFFPWKDIYVEGIRSITMEDIFHAQELGYCIKLLAIAKDHGEFLEARIHPVLLKKNHILADVSGANNGINISGSFSGDVLLCAQGAGRYPTASSVIGDILTIAKQNHSIAPKKHCFEANKTLLPMKDIVTRYFLRFMVNHSPGVLAQITHIFADYSIGIDSVIQKEPDSEHIPLVIMTDFSKESNIQNALQAILKLQTVNSNKYTLLRVED